MGVGELPRFLKPRYSKDPKPVVRRKHNKPVNRGGMTQEQSNAHNNRTLRNRIVREMLGKYWNLRFQAKNRMNKAEINALRENINLTQSENYYNSKIRKWNSLAANNPNAKGKAAYYKKRLALLREFKTAKKAHNILNQTIKEMQVEANKRANKAVNEQRAKRNAKRAVARAQAAANRQRWAQLPSPKPHVINW